MSIPPIVLLPLAFGLCVGAFYAQLAGYNYIDRSSFVLGRTLLGIGIFLAFLGPFGLLFGWGLLSAWNRGLL